MLSDIIKDILVFAIAYLPPFILFSKFWRERKRSLVALFIIGILYVVASMYTQNLLPFILVVINISFLKRLNKNYLLEDNLHNNYFSIEKGLTISDKCKEDYFRYKFSLKTFNLLKGLKYALISYVLTILISIVVSGIFSKFNIPVREQDVVKWMNDLPLKLYILMIPVAVIFAPVVEEFVFRWIFFEKIFKDRVGIYLSAILSSIIFSTIHYNLKAFPILLCIGLFNCYLIHKKGYWYSVFNHLFFNLITTALLLLSKLNLINLSM